MMFKLKYDDFLVYDEATNTYSMPWDWTQSLEDDGADNFKRLAPLRNAHSYGFGLPALEVPSPVRLDFLL